MFLSKLTPDLYDGGVRRDLRNPYDLHRTLLRAFPDGADGGPGRVLFRVEVPRGAAPIFLVQSDKEPDWARLPSSYLAACQTKPLDGLVFQAGQLLTFRLRANPTKRAGKSAPFLAGKRIGLARAAEQEGWLQRKGEQGGFRVADTGFRVIPEGQIVARKNGLVLPFHAVRFEGVLTVMDPPRFRQTLTDGIGSGKGLGFGLLSIGPASA